MPESPLLHSDGTVGVTVKLGGRTVPDVTQIISVAVIKDIGTIPEATLSIVVGDPLVDEAQELNGSQFKLGATITIAAHYGDHEHHPLFDGLITGIRFRAEPGGRFRLDMTCRDTAVKLLELRGSAIYDEMTDSAVMTKIIQDAGLQADVAATDDAAASRLRHATSDWEFLRILADRNGFVLFADVGKITIAAPATDTEAPLSVALGRDLIDFDVTIDAQRAIGSAAIAAWNPQDQTVTNTSNSHLPDMTLGSTTSAAIAAVLGRRVRATSTAANIAEADLGRIAKSRVMRSAMAALRGRCRFQGSGMIKPGDMLEIKGTGALFSKTAYVSGVRQTIKNGNWITETTLGLPADRAADRPVAGSSMTGEITAPLLGLQIGKVMTIAEDPSGDQRIKVKLPMVGDPAAEVWARYCQPYASKAAGIQFMPEVDDEVVIGFLSADPNAPIVLGALHSAALPQAIAPEVANNQKGIITREDLKILFDDDKKIITLSTPGGHSIKLDDDAKELTLADMNGNTVIFSASGIAVKSDKDITITATGKIDLKASQDATVKGMNVTCNGDTGFTGKGGATAELSSGGQTTVKGAMVMIN